MRIFIGNSFVKNLPSLKAERFLLQKKGKSRDGKICIMIVVHGYDTSLGKEVEWSEKRHSLVELNVRILFFPFCPMNFTWHFTFREKI
jgi:hypothetical protein